MNIPQEISCQQTKNFTNEIAWNSKERSKLIDTALFATLAKSSKQRSRFSQIGFILFKRDALGDISEKHISSKIRQFIDFGLFVKKACGYYDLTELGEKFYDMGFKYHMSRLVDMKRYGKEAAIEYLKTMPEGAIFESGKESGKVFSGCSYIEETKERILNISSRLYVSFVDHLSMTPEQRMLKNIKRMDLGIEGEEIDAIFTMVRRNVGFIKDKRWFDEFKKCVQTAVDWLKYCRECWEDGETYFATLWKNMGRAKTFTSAGELYELLAKLITNKRQEWERDSHNFA